MLDDDKKVEEVISRLNPVLCTTVGWHKAWGLNEEQEAKERVLYQSIDTKVEFYMCSRCFDIFKNFVTILPFNEDIQDAEIIEED